MLKLVLALNLMAIAALVFLYPHLMVAPGKLIAAHQQLESNCFACHAPFRGIDSKRCTDCHKVSEIGKLTSTGQTIARSDKHNSLTSFHQKLLNQDCVTCHSDHVGVMRFEPAHFNHASLATELRAQCQNCHISPIDPFHQQISGNCGQCHTSEKWVPTTFDHTRYFAIDGDHNARCVTCHEDSNYRRYTCYGCHEHTPEKIRSEHLEEGVHNFDNCVECHRNSNEHDMRNRGRKHDDEDEDN